MFEADRPNDLGTSLRKQGTNYLSKVLIGDSFGVWAENVDGQVRLTGVDLLYKDTFPLRIESSLEQILGFSNDRLVYLDKDNRLGYLTIKAPFNRSNRASDPIYIVIDGEDITFHAPPMLVNGTTMVEFRPILDKLGYVIEWDGKTRTVTATKGALEVKLTIDRKQAVINGKAFQLDVAPMIKNGYTYVPLRLVGEAAGRRVTWNQELQIAYIGPKDTADTLYYDKGTVKYVGDLVDGKRHGFGTSYSEDNGRVSYTGEWNNDQMDGHGQIFYHFTDALFFEGTMSNGKQAEGTEFYPGGDIRYQGTYRNGLHYNGTETVIFLNSGEYYIAEVKEGRLDGKAVYYFADGTVEFEGTLKGGVREQGKLYDQDGNPDL